MLSGRTRQPRANRFTQGQHLALFGRPPLAQVAQIQRRQQGERRLAVAEMPPHADVVARGDVLPCELQVDPVLKLAHSYARVTPHLWLVLFQPQRFAEEPFGADRPSAAAIDACGCIARRQDALGLVAGAHVHPQDGWAEGVIVGLVSAIKGDDGAAGGVNAHGAHVALRVKRGGGGGGGGAFGRRRVRGSSRRCCRRRRDALRDAPSHGDAHGAPPLRWILLGP